MPKTLPFFFPSVIYPLYLHVIIDFSHIWGPFMAEIEKMCQKSAFLVVPDFGYPQSRCQNDVPLCENQFMTFHHVMILHHLLNFNPKKLKWCCSIWRFILWLSITNNMMDFQHYDITMCDVNPSCNDVYPPWTLWFLKTILLPLIEHLAESWKFGHQVGRHA